MPSSVIKSFAYDPEREELEVLFTTGRRYVYFEVPAHEVTSFEKAFSKGRYFNARIRDNYSFEELEPAG